MTSSIRIPKAELTGIYGAMIKRMTRKKFGVDFDAVGVLWHNRKVLNTSFGLSRKAAKWDKCDNDLKLLAHMAVASLVGCSFCLDLAYYQAHTEGDLDVTKARAVPRWRESDVFTPLERDVMEYAEAMCQTTPTVTDEMSAWLRDQLGAPALVGADRVHRDREPGNPQQRRARHQVGGPRGGVWPRAAPRTFDGITGGPVVTHSSLRSTVAHEVGGLPRSSPLPRYESHRVRWRLCEEPGAIQSVNRQRVGRLLVFDRAGVLYAATRLVGVTLDDVWTRGLSGRKRLILQATPPVLMRPGR